MDDILFRHTAVATPNDKSEEFVKRANESEKSLQLVKEAKEFDEMLADCLEVEVPKDLNDKILLEQSFAIERERKMSGRWHLAIAASIAFIIGLSVPMLSNFNQVAPDIGTVALQHVQQEYYMTAKANEQATIQNVNAKLARYGGTAQDGIGEVYFVNYCSLKGTPALHMILQGEKGRVTVYVLSDDSNLKASAEFSNEHFKGISEKVGRAKLVIVGEPGEPLEQMKAKLDENITWDI